VIRTWEAIPAASPAYAFAEAMGFESVHREDHLVLALLVDIGHLASVRAAVEGRARRTRS
jgi:hypothetical protein